MQRPGSADGAVAAADRVPRVPHLLVATDWLGPALALDAAAVHHVRRVLRLEEGDAVTYTDGGGVVGAGTLEGETVLRGHEREVGRRAPHLTMAVAPPRAASRARMVVEKLAELGVDRLVWLDTTRGSGKPPRADRAEAWVRAAVEQSKGAWLMDIGAVERPTGPWLDGSRVVVCDRDGGSPWSILKGDQPILGLVGPEGGFTAEELPGSRQEVSLGEAVLRVETAAIALAVVLRAPGPR